MIDVRTEVKTCILDRNEIVYDISSLPILNENYTADGDVFLYGDEALKIIVPLFKISEDFASSKEKMIFLRKMIQHPLFLSPLRIAETDELNYCGYTSTYKEPKEDGIYLMSSSEFLDGFDELQDEFYALWKKGIEIVDSSYNNLLVSQDENGCLKPYVFDFDRYRYLDANRDLDRSITKDIEKENQKEFQFLCFDTWKQLFYHHTKEEEFYKIRRNTSYHLNDSFYEEWKEELKHYDRVSDYVEHVKRKVL